MSQEDPLVIVIMFALSIYLAKLWLADYKQSAQNSPHPKAFPGAHTCPALAIVIAVVGSLFILGAEVIGEYVLNIVGEQSTITWIFFLSITAAAFIEELIFRGYLFINNKGKPVLILSIIGFSLIFSLLHPFLWKWEEGIFSFNFSTKALFSTSIIFLNSLWFYYVRLFKLNPKNSLLPCMVAHLTSNWGVFIIKLIQGHVVGLY